MSEQSVARIGDHVSINCSEHGLVSGAFTEGSNVVFADGISVVLVGHNGTADCGHHFHATSGSSVYDVGGIPVVRVTDTVEFTDSSGTGTVVDGSPNVFSA